MDKKCNKTKKDFCNADCCVPPIDIFSTAAGISLLLYENYNLCQLETILNLLTLIEGNLTGFITQIEINKTDQVEPPF